MQWAALTGDIVASSRLQPDELDRIMTEIDAVSRDCSDWHNITDNKTVTAFARRGGDGWQLAINRPKLAFRVALLTQARIRSLNGEYETRIAAAAGQGEVPEHANLNSAFGEVFKDSGRLLDALPNRTLMAHADGGALDAAFRLADHIAQGWTEAQARALCLMLPPDAGPRRLAAKQLGISRQAVDQALNAAGYPALIAALEAIEGTNA